MDSKWLEYDMATIFADKRKGGLLVSFLREYKDAFNLRNVNASCGSCFKNYYKNYLSTQKITIMSDDKKCDYVLKAKYNGIQLGTAGRPIRNGEMTNEVAKELLEKHPHGAALFSVMPEPKKEVIEVIKEEDSETPKPRKKRKSTKSKK